jgi:hypothetical protein
MQNAKASKLAGFKLTSDMWNQEIDSALKNFKGAIRE